MESPPISLFLYFLLVFSNINNSSSVYYIPKTVLLSFIDSKWISYSELTNILYIVTNILFFLEAFLFSFFFFFFVCSPEKLIVQQWCIFHSVFCSHGVLAFWLASFFVLGQYYRQQQREFARYYYQLISPPFDHSGIFSLLSSLSYKLLSLLMIPNRSPVAGRQAGGRSVVLN